MSSVMNKQQEQEAPALNTEALQQFVFREARLQDEHCYSEWEALWADDGVYWVPANADDSDPKKHVAFIFDNRARLAGRIRQLNSGRRHAQMPPSRIRRVISNFEYEVAGPLIQVYANFMLTEMRNGRRFFWNGRTRYDLRPHGGSYQIVLKKVMLVDNEEAIPNLGFLI